ncbi:MAG: GC-type dockerin domain-anchored protein [Planctomycetota bacterium]
MSSPGIITQSERLAGSEGSRPKRLFRHRVPFLAALAVASPGAFAQWSSVDLGDTDTKVIGAPIPISIWNDQLTASQGVGSNVLGALWTLNGGAWTQQTGQNVTQGVSDGIAVGSENGDAFAWGWNGTVYPNGQSIAPTNSISSQANAIRGVTAVGSAELNSDTVSGGSAHVWELLSNGTFTSVRLDRGTLNDGVRTFATGTDGELHCGIVEGLKGFGACYWDSSGTLIEIGAPGFNTAALGIDQPDSGGIQIVGNTDDTPSEDLHGVMWTSSTSFVNLTPNGVGLTDDLNSANGVFRGYQVGNETLAGADTEARLWNGSPGSAINLHQLLPSGTSYDLSRAYSIWLEPGTLRVAGVAEPVNTNTEHLIVWTYECAADLVDPPFVLNFFDLSAFIDLYNAGDPAADIAAPFGTLNFFDIQAYNTLYLAGCPPM